ncbi:MAG: hypothetical protein ACI8QS_001527 [Planctomycetota bacterium]|jgi:hypothetical protein
MQKRPLTLFGLFGGGLLIALGLLILWAALRPAPNRVTLIQRTGLVIKATREQQGSGGKRESLLCIELNDGAEAFFVTEDRPDFAAIVTALQIGDNVSALVEAHAGQLLKGTPLARGRTEAWELIQLAPSDAADPKTLVAYADSSRARTRQRAKWGMAASFILLMGAYGLSQARHLGRVPSPSASAEG